ncbi:MAG: c-type cytochrome biogenesis protein CcsB [Thermomicrobiales bacterium]|nr:MAG: c-type cytochrome biogenesis protein CcsB [Thermomicrobiales bacterium]
MEGMVRLSFYLFAAASISVAAAWVSYVVYAVGILRLRRTAVATSAGIAMSGPTAEFGPPSASAGRFGTLFGWFAAIFSGLAVLTRAIASHRGPYSNMFEFSLAFVFVVTLSYMLFERFYEVKQFGAILMTIALGMCLYLWSLPPRMREVDALNPALQNRPLMTVHVSAAILAYATFAVSFAAAVLFLIQLRKNVSWLPSAEMLDDIGYRAVTIGFPMLALVLILGSVWAHQAWGAYWSWDPKETAALFTWLVYGVYLHTRSLRGWRGQRSAIILIIGFIAVGFTYYGNYFFGGLHAYGGVN